MTNKERFDLFQNKEYTLQMAEHTLKLIAKDCYPQGDGLFRELYISMARNQAVANLERIYQYSESPIETVFLCTMQFHFMSLNPTMFKVMEPPPGDALGALDRHIAANEDSFVPYAFYQNLPADVQPNSYEKFLRRWQRDGGIDPDGVEHLLNQATFGYELGGYHGIHLVLQPTFSKFREGKDIRVDALVWVPSNPAVKIVIECDGFEFHNSKESFIQDRQRDRLLTARGWTVHRFSGSEIYQDVIGVAEVFCKDLHQKTDYGSSLHKKWEKKFKRKYKAQITPTADQVDQLRIKQGIPKCPAE